MPLIRTTAEARAAIGQTVYWDDVSPRYVFLRQGVVQEVHAHNVMIDGDWKWLPNLKRNHLRTEEVGGAWTPERAAAYAKASAALKGMR